MWCELCSFVGSGVRSSSGDKEGSVYLLEGVKAAVEFDSEVEVEVWEKCLEGFVRVVVDVDVPGFEEGRMFGVV